MFEDVSMNDKKVLITGGASGIGLEIAKVFIGAGSQVLICDISQELLAAATAECPGLHGFIADVSDEASVAALFQHVEATLGGLDVLINNAGIAGPTGNVETLGKMDWDKTLAVNITGHFLCARLAIPLLKKAEAGVMVNMSSAAGHLGFAGRSAYSASKWAVIGFTKSLAIELGRFGVRVNAILPGAVEGPRIQAVMAAKAKALGVSTEEMERRNNEQASLGRLVSARDIANMALFSASGAAGNVTGQALVVDGHTQALI